MLFFHATCPLEYSEFFESAKISVYHIEVALSTLQWEAPGDFEEWELVGKNAADYWWFSSLCVGWLVLFFFKFLVSFKILMKAEEAPLEKVSVAGVTEKFLQ